MKVIIDLDRLLSEGEIDPSEYERLRRLSAREMGALVINLLAGFGMVAVVVAALALVPAATTAVVIGLLIGGGGCILTLMQREQWMGLAHAAVAVGALLVAGGVVTFAQGAISAFLIAAAVLVVAGVFIRSRLLIVGAVLALSSCLGARTGYIHATYFLGIQEPTATTILFGIFSIGCYGLAERLGPEYRGLALVASRTGVFLVNFGLWIGSLWGDRLGVEGFFIPDWVFAMVWAVVLVAAAFWAWRADRRWLINVVAVFAAIHFYTQWFERLGTSAGAVLLAGLIALAFAIGLRALNLNLGKKSRQGVA